MYAKKDNSSLSNATEVVTRSIHLDWTLDFDRKVIHGSATHTLEVLSDGNRDPDGDPMGLLHADFDSSKLRITAASIAGEATAFEVAPPHAALGSRVRATIPAALRHKGATFELKFDYSTDPDASAIQWLEPSATKGGLHPYVFTQCQAIHARSLLPCMDGPGVKATYTATVRAPEWCTVLMSALPGAELASARKDTSGSQLSTPISSPTKTSSSPAVDSSGKKGKNAKGKKAKGGKEKDSEPPSPQTVAIAAAAPAPVDEPGVFRWHQPVPTPAYLIALAAGRLASRDVSSRVRIWSEPEVVDAAAFEFSETEDFLKAAESLTCPYQWTRYDVLCLPPSFPYGGMENPCLTFATPTLLAGDRSLADVIAHEIAHSWTGNLVTNHTWEHFWLNEGWTVWLERKIMSRVKGSNEVLKLSAQGGWKHLKDDVARFGADGVFTRLVWPLEEGADPDDAFSSVPYEKGFNLLNYLESLVGSPAFEAFAKSYIDKFKFSTVTSGEFRDLFASQFPAASASVDWDTWLLGTGMPTPEPDFSNTLSADALALAADWLRHGAQFVDSDALQASVVSWRSWGTQQRSIFLEALQSYVEENDVLSDAVLRSLDATYGLTAVMNSEVRFRWQALCLYCDADWIVPHVVDFVTSQGRMKFVRPLYRLLRGSEAGSLIAAETFRQHSNTYHPIARKMVAADLKLADDADAAVIEIEEALSQSESVSENVAPPNTVVEEPVATQEADEPIKVALVAPTTVSSEDVTSPHNTHETPRKPAEAASEPISAPTSPVSPAREPQKKKETESASTSSQHRAPVSPPSSTGTSSLAAESSWSGVTVAVLLTAVATIAVGYWLKSRRR